MQKKVVFCPKLSFLWFVLALVFLFGWRSLMSGGPYATFEPIGYGWILLKSLFYAMVCQIVYLLVSGALTEKHPAQLTHSAILSILSILLISADVPFLNGFGPSLTDRCIRFIGYQISQLFSYKPVQTPINKNYPAAAPAGSIVTVNSSQGQITLLFGPGTVRTVYFGTDSSKTEQRSFAAHTDLVDLGNQGYTFNSNDLWTGYCWKELAGISRCQYTEARINFNSTQAALAWIGYLKKHQTIVCSKNGLIVGFYRSRMESLLILRIYQILVNGKKPNLPIADNVEITLEGAGALSQ